MKRISKSEAIAQMDEWARCVNKDIPQLFDRFFEDKVGIKNQWHRLTAIRFGKVTKDFKKHLSKAEKVSLCMGVVKSGEKKNSLLSFNLLIRIQKKKSNNGATFYYECRSKPQNLSDDPLQPGLVYGAVQSPEKGEANGMNRQLELEGIRSALKNQYCSNWCMVDSDGIPNLFQAEQTDLRGVDRTELLFHEFKKGVQSTQITGGQDNKGLSQDSVRKKGELIVYNPFNRARVRALHYEVNGYSLEVLKKKLKKIKGRYLTINLGMNPGGIYFNKNQFSLVLEVLTRQKEMEISELDRWKTGSRNGKEVVNLLFRPKEIEQPLYAPNLVLSDPPHRFWVNNEFMQGEVIHNSDAGNLSSDLDNVEDFQFSPFESTFDDFLHPCPPFCDPPPGQGG